MRSGLFMGVIGYGYGSEWQLLRALGRHRKQLDSVIKKALVPLYPSLDWGTGINWWDFGYDGFADVEWIDLNDNEHKKNPSVLKALAGTRIETIKQAWEKYWLAPGSPRGRSHPNFDAVADVPLKNGKKLLLLVEAKGHLSESRNAGSFQGGWPKKTQATALQIETEALLKYSFSKYGNEPLPGVHYIDSPYYQIALRIHFARFIEKEFPDEWIPVVLYLTFVNDWTGSFYPNSDKLKFDYCVSSAKEWKQLLDHKFMLLGFDNNAEAKRKFDSDFVWISYDAIHGSSGE
jgi:hypothetical protein